MEPIKLDHRLEMKESAENQSFESESAIGGARSRLHWNSVNWIIDWKCDRDAQNLSFELENVKGVVETNRVQRNPLNWNITLRCDRGVPKPRFELESVMGVLETEFTGIHRIG